MADNIMMDASLLYTDNYHPIYIERTFDLQHTAKHLTRTQAPPTYYLIDFGLSRQYASDEAEPMEDIIRGGDKTVPEHRTGAIGNVDGRCNPFPTDVYYLGNMVREEFLDKEVSSSHPRESCISTKTSLRNMAWTFLSLWSPIWFWRTLQNGRQWHKLLSVLRLLGGS